MQYQGGKSKHAKRLAAAMRADTEGRVLVEPFVGGFNVVPAMPWIDSALCSDSHAGLTGMYKALQAGGWTPPTTVTEEQYGRMRLARDSTPTGVFASFACSWGAKEWGGYARSSRGSNYARGAARSLLRKAQHMAGVRFSHSGYSAAGVPAGAVVYCDPPYSGTTGYRTGRFDSQEFYKWAESVAVNHVVFVSEFSAPPHWPVVLEFERFKDIDKGRATERLYRLG